MLDLTPAEWTAVALSLRIAVVATACALPFGIAIGWLLARTNFWGKSVLDGIVFLPLVMPPVVTGYLLLIWFGRKAPLGAFLGQSFWHRLFVPLDRRGAGVRHHGLSLDGAPDPAGAGGDRSQAGRRRGDAGRQPALGVPYRDPAAGIAGHHRRRGACALHARSGEFGATITFVSNIPGETQTISALIYTLTQVPGGDAAAGRLVLIAIVLAFAALLASEWLARRAAIRFHGE